MNNIQDLAQQTKEKLDQMNQLAQEIDNLWKPFVDNLDNMTEKEIGEILMATGFYQAGFHIKMREYSRRKFM